MATKEEYRKINCPSCGAPLSPSEETSARCPYCGTVLEKLEPEISSAIVVELRPEVVKTAGSRLLAVVVVAVAMVLVAAGVVLALVLSRVGGTGGGTVPEPMRRSVRGEPIPLPSDRTGPADLLLFTYDIPSSQTFWTYLDGAAPAWRWDSPPLTSNADDVRPVIRGDSVYLVDETRLYALNLADGSVRWQTTLSDKVLNICRDCLQVVGDYVIVLTNDGHLHGLEIPSGRPAWEVVLNETPRQLWQVGGKIAVMDKEAPGDYRSMYMQLRDPTTGQMVQHLQGVCPRDHGEDVLPIYDPIILLAPGGKDVYFFYSGFPGCAQRWDVENARLVWQTAAQEENYYSDLNRQPIWTEQAIYGAYEGQLMAFDTATGERRILMDDPNYELAPVAESGGVLIVLAERTRGSTRYELWGVAVGTSERRWQRLFEGEEPLEEPGAWAGSALSWHLTPRGLMVLHMQQEPRRFVLETIDPQTGATSGQAQIDLADDTWPWEAAAWTNDYLWVTTIKLYALDLGSGELLWKWP